MNDLTSNDDWLRQWNLDHSDGDPRQRWLTPCSPLECYYGADPLSIIPLARASVCFLVVLAEVFSRHPQLSRVGGGGER